MNGDKFEIDGRVFETRVISASDDCHFWRVVSLDHQFRGMIANTSRCLTTKAAAKCDAERVSRKVYGKEKVTR